jgi:hypothetical protein
LHGGERGAKNGSFDFAKGGSGEGQKQMCHLCGWIKKFRAFGIFLFFSVALVSAVFRLAVADN